MIELGNSISRLKEAVLSLTPQRTAERRINRAVENVAAVLSLDVIRKGREFYLRNGVVMPIDQQLSLARYQEQALMTLARNGAINSQGVTKVYTEMSWPL